MMHISTMRQGIPAVHDDVTSTRGVIDVSGAHQSERTFVQALVSLAAAAGLGLLVPLAVLLVGLPLALGLRGLLEIVQWLLR